MERRDFRFSQFIYFIILFVCCTISKLLYQPLYLGIIISIFKNLTNFNIHVSLSVCTLYICMKMCLNGSMSSHLRMWLWDFQRMQLNLISLINCIKTSIYSFFYGCMRKKLGGVCMCCIWAFIFLDYYNIFNGNEIK